MTATQAGELDDVNSADWVASRSAPFTVRDFLSSALYHLRIVLLVALIPLGLGIGAAILTKTQYTASSLVMVIVSREVTDQQSVTGSGPSVLSIEGLKQVESDVQIIESAEVIRSAIESIGMERLYPPTLLTPLRDLFLTGSPMDRAMQRFRSDLRAQVLDGSNVIEVSFTNPDRSLAIEVTDKVVQAYMARRRAILDNPTSAILLTEVARFKRDLAAADAAIEALKGRAGIIDFNQDAVLAANQVDSIMQRRRQVAERRVAVTGQIAEAERQLKELPERVFDFDQNSNTLGNDEDHNTLSRLLLERDRIATQYSPNGSMMRDINRKIETIRQQIATRNERQYTTSRDVRNPAIGYVNNMLISLRIEADALDKQDRELDQQKEQAEKRLADLRVTETELVELNRRRDSLNEGYREYLRRATAAQIEEAAATERESNVRLVQEAGAAVTSRNMRLPYLGAGILGSMFFGVAAGAMASAMRSSFILPSEVERALNLPLLGEYANQSRTDLPNADAEDLGSLASLLFDTQVDGRPVRYLHLIATDEDPALSPLAYGIVSEVARKRELLSLLVDITGARTEGAQLSEARLKGGLQVAPTSTPLLWCLTDRETSPLLDVHMSTPEVRRQKEQLAETFEAVVVASTAQEPAAVSRRIDQLADGVVLVIRAGKTRKAAASALQSDVIDNGGVPLGFILVGRRYVLPGWIYRLF